MTELQDLFCRHDRVGLLFSGGKDSMSCFYLCEPWWDQVDLVWVDTGRNLPEVEALVAKCAAKAGRFTRLVSDQHRFVAAHGHPSDLVVSDSTYLGKLIRPRDRGEGPKVCDKWECCKANIWDPIARWMDTTDCTAVIKGQKACDGYIGPSHMMPAVRADGTTLEMCLPVYDWTDDQCRVYLTDKADPELLALEHTSFDCWDCTGYWHGLPGRIEYLRKHHPAKAEHVVQVFGAMRKDMARTAGILDNYMENLKNG